MVGSIILVLGLQNEPFIRNHCIHSVQLQTQHMFLKTVFLRRMQLIVDKRGDLLLKREEFLVNDMVCELQDPGLVRLLFA